MKVKPEHMLYYISFYFFKFFFIHLLVPQPLSSMYGLYPVSTVNEL